MTGSVIVLERTIDASMEDVWGVLMDAEHQAEMFDGVTNVEFMEMTPPEHAVMSGMMGHDEIGMTFALTPQRMNQDRTRLAITMHADIKHRSLLGQTMWHVWGGFQLAHDRRVLMHDLEEIARTAEARAHHAA